MTTEQVEHTDDRQRGFKPERLHDLFKSLESYHSQRIANQERWDAKYYQDVSWARSLVPSDIRIFQSSQATDLVDETADQIRTDEPVIRYVTKKETEETRKHAALMIQWAQEQMDADRRMAEIDPYSQTTKDAALRGEAVVKQLHNPDRPEEPVRKDFASRDDFEAAHVRWEGEMSEYQPLLPARIVDPLNIFLPPNARAPFPYVIEHQKRTANDMWRDYPDYKRLFTGRVPGKRGQMNRKDMEDPAREVDWLEFWSPDHYIVEVDGVRIFDRPNPYGFVPYWHEYSGLGRIDRNSGSDRKAIGIIGKVEGELEGDVMLRTITFAAATQYVFPRIKAPEDQVQVVQSAMAQRSVIPYDPALGPNSIEWLESPALKPDVTLALGQIREAISRRISPSQAGVPTNAQSGVQEAIRIGQSAKGQTDIVEAVNNLATGLVNLKARMMKSLDLEIELENGKVLKGVDFSDPNFEVQFNAFDPVEDSRRQQNGLTLMREGAITKRTMRKEFLTRLITDPDDEEIQEGLEAAWNAWIGSAEFQQWAVQQHMGDEAVKQQQLLGEGGSGGQGGAGGGGTSDAQRAESLALLESLAPTTDLGALGTAEPILNGGSPGGAQI